MTQNPNSSSRTSAFAWVTFSYILAIALGVLAGYWTDQQGQHLMVSIGVADIVATLVIFAFSYRFNNSSFYDPYWSIIPIVIVGFLTYVGLETAANPVRIFLLLGLISFWGIRLTFNWARGWTGLHHQDWRYVDLEAKHGKLYWLVSFGGIHFFPTALVFMGCLALYPAMMLEGQPLGVIDILAFIVTLGAVLIEFIADEQLRKFVKNKKEPGETMTSGLWGYSRHPNYFGETAFWWGIFLFGIAARPDYWWVIIGPLGMTILFHFISIPMIEERMLRKRDNYKEVIAKVPRWIPWFPKS